MKEKIKKVAWFLFNPRLLFCIGIAWIITNGWSYIMFAAGTYYKIEWMVAISGAYLSLLWLPFTPEKIITCAIAIALLRFLFPNDTKTLAILKNALDKAKVARNKRKEDKNHKKEESRNSSTESTTL